MRTLLGCTLLLVVCWGVSAEDKKEEKIDAKKLVGKWEPKEQEDGQKFVMEFTKDGKLAVSRTVGGNESKYDGTYKVDGNKLTVTATVDGKEERDTRTITKLTDVELITTGTGNAKEFTMVRIKDKK